MKTTFLVLSFLCFVHGLAEGQTPKTFHDLTAASVVDGDEFPFWDVSASGTRKVTFADFKTALAIPDVSGLVPSTRTVNGLALSGNITISDVTGNAATATVLATARTINGVSFDGSGNITVTAAAGTLTGTTLAANVVSSSLTSAAGGSFGTNAFSSTTFLTPAGNGSALTGLTKSQVSLGNVDNTSDATKNAAAVTLTNKRMTARVTAIAYASTVTPAGDTTDVANIGALTGNITIADPSGTPTDGQKLTFRLAQDGTGSRTIAWGSSYAFGTDVTAALIPSAASSKWEMVFQYCTADSKWRAVGIARGF